VDRDFAVARQWVEEAETASKQEQEDMRSAEKVELNTRKSETTYKVMLNTISNGLRDLGSSTNQQDGDDKEDNQEDTALGKMNEDEESSWVMGTISKTVQQSKNSLGQK